VGVNCEPVDKGAISRVTLFIATETNTFVESQTFPRPLVSLEFKRRDNPLVYIGFLQNNTRITLNPATTAIVGVKQRNNYEGPFLALSTEWTLSDNDFYELELNFNTIALNNLFSSLDNPAEIEAMLEVEWRLGTRTTSSKTLPIIIHNDVITEDSGEPIDVSLPSNDYFYMRSGNGTVWQVTVDNTGAFVVSSAGSSGGQSSSTTGTSTTTATTYNGTTSTTTTQTTTTSSTNP